MQRSVTFTVAFIAKGGEGTIASGVGAGDAANFFRQIFEPIWSKFRQTWVKFGQI